MLPLIFFVKVSALDEFSLSETNTYNYVEDYEKNNSHYNLSMKNKNKVGNETLLTVLTPGLGSSASHFADFKNENKEYRNVSNKNNIVNYLCQKLDNEVDIKDERYIKLTAVWEVINYNITYHYNGFNGSYATFVEKYNFYEEKVLQKLM